MKLRLRVVPLLVPAAMLAVLESSALAQAVTESMPDAEPATESTADAEQESEAAESSGSESAGAEESATEGDAALPMAAPVYGADMRPRSPRWSTGDVRGQARFRYNQVSDFATDDLGTRHGREAWTETRLVLGGFWAPTERVRLEVEVDGLNGQASGDVTALGQEIDPDLFRISRYGQDDLRRVYPRKALVQFDTSFARFIVGAQTFGWGTGMLANDGLSEQDFGDAWRGSLVARIAVLTQPLRNRATSAAGRGWTVLAAGDRVIEDDNASWYDGDDAWSAIVGTRIDTARWTVGAFNALRWQTDRPDPLYPVDRRTTVRVSSVDVYGKWTITEPGGDHRVQLEGEAALIAGRTDRPWLDETFEDGARVQSMGALLRVRYDAQSARLTARLDAGYASGDNDPRDDVARAFSFHTDYNVGLILFDQVMPMLTARAGDRVFDPDLLAVPPSGVRYTAAQGGVTNAGYLNPVVRWQPVRGLDARVGWLYAVAAAELVDVYQSALAGGFNTGFGGVTGGSRVLGHEVNLGLRYKFDIDDSTAIRFGGEGGVFLPGAAFDGVGGGDGLPTLTMWRGTLDVLW